MTNRIQHIINNIGSTEERIVIQKMYNKIHEYGEIDYLDLMLEVKIGFAKHARLKPKLLKVASEEIEYDSYTEKWRLKDPEQRVRMKSAFLDKKREGLRA